MKERIKNRLRLRFRLMTTGLALAVFLAVVATAAGVGLPGGAPAPVAAQGGWGLHQIAEVRLASSEVTAWRGTNTRIAFSLHNAAGDSLSGLVDWGAVWEGADAAARGVVSDMDGRDTAIQGYLYIPIRDDARAGAYRFNVSSRARNENNEPYDTAVLTVYVVGPPDYLRAYLNGTEFDAGTDITLRATLRDENSQLASFVRNGTYGTGVATPCAGCVWAAADDDSAAALGVSQGALGSGRAVIPVAANAPSGAYGIIVSHPEVPDRTLNFSVRGRDRDTEPAGYTLSAGDSIGAGASASYTVTARSRSGDVPDLEGNNGRVYVFVDGAGKDAATLSGVGADGSLALDSRGVGRFGVSVADGTEPTTIRLDVAGVWDTAVVSREISIGSVPPPRDVTATAGMDEQGASTIVNLRWTPAGAGTTEQVAVVVSSDDDTDYCLEVLAADAGSFSCVGRTPGQSYVGLVIGLLPGGGYTLGNVATITLPAGS